MQYKEYKFNLSLDNDMHTIIRAKQGETGVKLIPKLIHNNTNYDVSNTTVKSIFRRPNGFVSYLDCITENAAEGEVSVVLTNQILNEAGFVTAEIQLTGDKGLIKSWTFKILVRPGVGIAEIESSNELSALESALAEVEVALTAEAQRLLNEDEREANEILREQLKAELEVLKAELSGGPVARTEFDNHLNSNMPHLIVDTDTNKTYRYGLQVKNGMTQIIYEEVI